MSLYLIRVGAQKSFIKRDESGETANKSESHSQNYLPNFSVIII
ncbi:hypothetical protein [Okeania sp.]|nr:hypothetical protein [Okeania sp.]MEB3339856.1 hypothetical protein [Okeania sp.]